MTNPAWGICGPTFDFTKPQLTAKAFKLMQDAGLTEYRCQFNLTDDSFDASVRNLKTLQTFAAAFGIVLRPLLQPPFAFEDAMWKTDNGRHPAGANGDIPSFYAQGYDRGYNFVRQFPDITTWELGNEINLLVRDVHGSPLFGKGQTVAEFNNVLLMRHYAGLLRGMCNGIDQVGREIGVDMRKTLGTTSTMFGFLDMMKNHNVAFDRISYHMYDMEGVNPHNYWNGTLAPFDLFKKLDSYGLPVTINEINAAETYGEPFGGPYNEPKAIRSLTGMIKHLRDGSFKNLESVLFYSLLDNPAQPVPENRFGMLRVDGSEKSIFTAVKRAIL